MKPVGINRLVIANDSAINVRNTTSTETRQKYLVKESWIHNRDLVQYKSSRGYEYVTVCTPDRLFTTYRRNEFLPAEKPTV